MEVLSAALGALFVQRATRDGRINLHRIMGACGSFLMLGLLFSQAYRLLALYVPHAFAIGATTGRLALFSRPIRRNASRMP